MYQIVRIFFKGETESHSIEEREDYRDALTRFYSIIATDLGNAQNTYCFATILNDWGQNIVEPFYYCSEEPIDETEENLPFDYAVLRVRVKNDQRSTSVEYKTNQEEAFKRYFTILATDLDDATVTYNMGAVIDPRGSVLEGKGFRSTAE